MRNPGVDPPYNIILPWIREVLIAGLLFTGLSVCLFLMVQFTRKMPRSEWFSLCFNSKSQFASGFKTGIPRARKRSFASPFITQSSLYLTEGHCGHFQRETVSHCGGSIRIFISSYHQCGCGRVIALRGAGPCTNRSARKDWVLAWRSRKSSALKVIRKHVLVLEVPLTCGVTLKKAGHLFYPRFSAVSQGW